MRKLIALLAVGTVCLFGGIASAEWVIPQADLVSTADQAVVDPVPGGMVSWTMSLTNILSVENSNPMNGMSFTPFITPLDGGSASDLQLSMGSVHPDLQGFLDGIGGAVNDISSPTTVGYAIFANDANDFLPAITGNIATLYFTYDAYAVAGHSYKMNLDMSWDSIGGGSKGTKSYITTGAGFDALFMPSGVFDVEGDFPDQIWRFESGGMTLDETSITVTFIPEPATMLLLGGGLIGLVGLRRRK